MKISKFVHSCLLLEKDGQRVLIDPGAFSFVEGAVDPAQFSDLAAVLITHNHPDHLDPNAMKTIKANNPSAVVLGNEPGIHDIAGFRIEVFEAQHEKILGSEPPANAAFLIDQQLLHPGDSFAPSLDVHTGVPVLALPIMAPWTTELGVAEFAKRLSPQQVVPIHDGYAKSFFLEKRHENYAKLFSDEGVEFHSLAEPGSSIDLN